MDEEAGRTLPGISRGPLPCPHLDCGPQVLDFAWDRFLLSKPLGADEFSSRNRAAINLSNT